MEQIIQIGFLLLGLTLAVYVTILFVRLLGDGKGSFLSKFWQWLKALFDAISGIG